MNFPLRHPYKEVATEDMDAAKILLEVRDLEITKNVKILVIIVVKSAFCCFLG